MALQLPQWLLGSDNLTPEEEALKLQTTKKWTQLHDPMRIEAAKSLKANPSFLEDLKCCKNLSNLRVWAADYNIDLRRYSRLSFRYVYETRERLEVVLEALGDNALNNSDNLRFLLRQKMQNPLMYEEARIIGYWLKRTLFLGQWSESQLTLILDFILHISTLESFQKAKDHLIISAVKGLESSTVFGLKDLSRSQLSMLLDAITNGVSTGSSSGPGFRLLKVLEPYQLESLTKSISRFFQKTILVQTLENGSLGKESQDGKSIPKLFGFLQTFPQSVSCRVIIDISRALVERTPSPPECYTPLLQLLDQWWAWVRRSKLLKTSDESANQWHLERTLAGNSLTIVASYLRPLDDVAIARFMLQQELGHRSALNAQSRALESFRQTCQSDKNVSPFVNMLVTMQEISDVTEKTVQRTFRLLQMLHKSEAIADVIVSLRNAGIRISEHVLLNTIKAESRKTGGIPAKIFSLCRELPLEKCPELAESMIQNVRRRPLEALQQYVSRHPLFLPGCRERFDVLKARSQLLQRMALAYSTSTHLTPQMAFRYVYKCYTYHMREGLGPLGSGMVLALTRTGIVRPLERGEWVSTERLRWVLHLIRRFEGSQVADQVDELVYKWRGVAVKKIQAESQQRKLANHGQKESAMGFRIRNVWNRSQGRVDRILEPLEGLADETINHSEAIG